MTDDSWFDFLETVNIQKHYSWLANLPPTVERIANFGCWSGEEPFALLWTFDASDIMVIEKNAEHLEILRQRMEQVSHRYPNSLQGRTLRYLCRDMSDTIPELMDQYFDLVFCEDVLYNLQGDQDLLRRAISQMVRITKLSGWVIAVEPKYGVEVEWQETDFSGMKMSVPVALNEPKDMSSLFDPINLEKLEVLQQPRFAYCYQRTH